VSIKHLSFVNQQAARILVIQLFWVYFLQLFWLMVDYRKKGVPFFGGNKLM